MKTRLGFVSNSSSSSYIVGIGRIPVNMDQSKLWRDAYSTEVVDGASLIERSKNKWSHISIRDGKIRISGGGNGGCDASTSFDPDKDKNILFYLININNDEGDDDFSHGDCELDYDIDLDWFDNKQQKAYKQMQSLEEAEVYFGAERNG